MGILVTMNAEQGIEALKVIGADRNIPIHYDDYDVFKDLLRNFARGRSGRASEPGTPPGARESYSFTPLIDDSTSRPVLVHRS
jgi:L-ascorbate metabolism protein UlaG (beta-lactamase superfamily)